MGVPLLSSCRHRPRMICLGLLVLVVMLPFPNVGNITVAPEATDIPSTSAPPRILCYGDSLTLGLSPPTAIDADTYCPYKVPLSRYLNQEEHRYQIDHVGLSGWTTTQLLKQVHNPKMGLGPALSSTTELVLLLAGTNDIPRLLRNTKHDIQKAANYLVRNLWTLHEIALQEGARHSIAIAIPSSQYQERVPDAAQLVAQVNRQLEERVSNHPNMTFVPFPFPYVESETNSNSTGNWASDGLHLSCQGYEILAKALAPVVVSILKKERS